MRTVFKKTQRLICNLIIKTCVFLIWTIKSKLINLFIIIYLSFYISDQKKSVLLKSFNKNYDSSLFSVYHFFKFQQNICQIKRNKKGNSLIARA